MTNHPNRGAQPRPRQHLIAAGKLYPSAWQQFDEFRQSRGQDGLPEWPDWCYLPMAAAYAVVSGGGANRVPFELAGDVGRLAALGAWRPSQGIYQIDSTLFADLWATPLSGDLPCDLLQRLPEWCIYVETPGQEINGDRLHGFFAHLEWDANSGREELRLLVDTETALFPVPIHLGPWTLEEAAKRAAFAASQQAGGASIPREAREAITQIAAPMVSTLLYICSASAEWAGARPERPQPKKTKKGWKLFPPDKPRVWAIGVRTGAALRQAYQQAETHGHGHHASPRGHMRRAHWHSYWTGPMEGERVRVLRWIPPIPVNLDPDDTPAVYRPVK